MARFVVERPIFLDGKRREVGAVLPRDVAIPSRNLLALKDQGKLREMSYEEEQAYAEKQRAAKAAAEAKAAKVGTERVDRRQAHVTAEEAPKASEPKKGTA